MLTLVADPLPAAVPTRAAGLQALADYKSAAVLAEDGSKSGHRGSEGTPGDPGRDLEGLGAVPGVGAKKAGEHRHFWTQSGFDLRQPPQPVPQPLPPPELKVFRNGFSNEIHAGRKTVDGACVTKVKSAPHRHAGAELADRLLQQRRVEAEVRRVDAGQIIPFRLRALGRDGWSRGRTSRS